MYLMRYGRVDMHWVHELMWYRVDQIGINTTTETQRHGEDQIPLCLCGLVLYWFLERKWV